MGSFSLFLIDDGIPDKNPRYLELIRQLRTQNPDLSVCDLFDFLHELLGNKVTFTRFTILKNLPLLT